MHINRSASDPSATDEGNMVLAFVEGSIKSRRFHRAIDTAENDENITELAFVCIFFCAEVIQRIKDLLSGRTWKSILISSCSGNVSSAIRCVFQADVESIELRSIQSFDKCVGQTVGKGIASSKNVTRLTLSIITMASETVKAICDAVDGNTSLQSLRLSCCAIPANAVKDVAMLLTKFKSLETLKLDSCKLDDTQMSTLLKAVKDIPKLKDIMFPYNKCGSETIKVLSQLLLSSGCQIRTLDCGRQYNEDINVDFGPLMSSLEHNCSIRCLNISYTRIESHDIIALASFLKKTESKLEILYLCGNQLSLKSIEALSAALPENQSLTKLWLTGTQSFGSAGIISLCRGLRDNMSLEEVLLPPWLPEHANEIEYYTDINKGGRKLFRDMTLPSSVWPHVLSRVNAMDMGEPDCFGTTVIRRASTLYHLLRNRVLLEDAS